LPKSSRQSSGIAKFQQQHGNPAPNVKDPNKEVEESKRNSKKSG
jgi:hypothetical protein